MSRSDKEIRLAHPSSPEPRTPTTTHHQNISLYKIASPQAKQKGDPAMSFPLTYRSAMNNIAQLANNNDQPGYVRVQALKTIIRELSPSNPGQRQNHQALGLEPHPEAQPSLPEAPLNAEQQKEFHLSPVIAEVNAMMRQLNEQAGIAAGDEDSTEEEDEPH